MPAVSLLHQLTRRQQQVLHAICDWRYLVLQHILRHAHVIGRVLLSNASQVNPCVPLPGGAVCTAVPMLSCKLPTRLTTAHVCVAHLQMPMPVAVQVKEVQDVNIETAMQLYQLEHFELVSTFI